MTTISGGVDLDAGRDVTIGGDVVGRDKITTIGYTVEQVSTLLTQISSTFQPKPFDGRCPYLGLDAFTEDDADRFFGRETLVSELVTRTKESRFVVIAGPSGSGKSSLVRAGLIHALRQGALPNSDRWLYATLTPGRDPIESLALALSRLAKSPDGGKYLREHSAEPSALHEFAESQLSDRKEQRAIIFVDQLEEVFTQVSKEEERLAFLNLLTHATTLESGRVTVLCALRSDFVSNCATYPQLNALLNQQFMQVGAMQPSELVSAIARPALQVRLRIDPDLIAQIVNDMQDEPGALPLMQFALKDLFDAQQAKGGVIALTLNDYLARGGLRKALERHADAAFAQLSESEQQLARTIFSGLIEIGRGTQDARRTAAFDELAPANTDAAQVKAVVRKLADARLITTDEQGDRDTVTIAHERLIEAWPWLHRLVNENREAISLQNQITADAQEWNEHQRDASYLYGGVRLATAQKQLGEQKITLNELAQKFVDAGVGAFESARQRQRRIIRGVISVLVIISIVFAGLSIWAINSQQIALQSAANESDAKGTAQANAAEAQRQAGIAQAASAKAVSETNTRATTEANALAQRDEAKRQAEIAFSRQLAAQAISNEDHNLDLALLLGREALRVADTAEARNSLLSGAQTNPRLAAFLQGHVAAIRSVAFSPDGKSLASGSWDKTIILWDVSNPRAPVPLGRPLTGHADAVLSMAFSPDGKTLASGGGDNTIILWNVSNPRAPVPLGRPLTGHMKSVWSVAFSPDGKMLASGSADDTVILWDASSPTSLVQLGTPLTGHADAVLSVAFSPDGKMLASSSADNTVILWNVSNPTSPVQLGTPLTGHTSSFSPDGKTLASGSADNTVILWDISNPTSPVQLGTPLTGHTFPVLSVAFSPDGKILASSSCAKPVDLSCPEGEIDLWDVSNPKSPALLGTPLTGHTDWVSSVAFSPDGKMLASGGRERTVILWDVSDLRVLTSLGTRLTGHTGSVKSVAFSSDGKTLASGGQDSIILWDVSNPRAPVPLGGPLTSHMKSVWSVAFSPDGKMLASVGLWDVSNPRVPIPLGTPLIDYMGTLLSVAFSPDGKTLASSKGEKTIDLWDVSDPSAPVPLGTPLIGHTDLVRSVAFSPDGKTLASGGVDRTIILWDVSNPKSPVQLGTPLTGHAEASNVAFSPDGKTLASGGVDSTVILWDVSNPGSPVQLGTPLTAHTFTVLSVAFSPDGKTLASGSWDNTIILWDVSNPRSPVQLGMPLTDQTDSVESVAFSPDGETLASGSSDSTVMLWQISPKALQVMACQRAGRNLTQAEWRRYLGDEPYHKTCEQWPSGE